MHNYKGNIPKIYAFRFFFMFLIIIPVIIPFYLSLNLSMSQIFILQAIMGFTVAVFEVPSGYLCDLWGRKKTMLLGSSLTAIGFIYLIFATTYELLIIHEIIIGIGLSMISGSDVSLLYDSLIQDEHSRENSSIALSNLQFSSALSETIASVVGGLLVKISFFTVITTHAFFACFPFFIALTLKEPPYQKMDNKSHKENTLKVLRHIFQSDKLLTLVFFNQIIWGLSTFTAVWIYQKHWSDHSIDLAYFGILWAAYNLTHGLVSKNVHFFEKRFGAPFLLVLMGLLPICGYFGLGALSGWFGVAVGFLFQVSRGITQVILKDALNWRTPSEFRATANSLVSLFFRLGFCLIGPLTGYLIDKQGMSFAMNSLAAFFILGFLVFLIPFIKMVRNQIPET
ncbi:MFS transporter [Halobacteriovorax sp. GB3]|uniref:MFS transporter n=1 Tax=Halobacteriovorax sp. GB3 TaxID=2719615 RepID=UPI003081C652